MSFCPYTNYFSADKGCMKRRNGADEEIWYDDGQVSRFPQIPLRLTMYICVCRQHREFIIIVDGSVVVRLRSSTFERGFD